MTEEISPNRRERRVFISYKCKSFDVPGSSWAEPAIAHELHAAYLGSRDKVLAG